MFPTNTHILVTDDTKAARTLVTKLLKMMGYQKVTEAPGGQESLDILYASLKENPVGLLITDWKMPGIDGVALLKQLRMNPNFSLLPVILLTAESDQVSLIEALKSGVSEYIIKPTTAPVLSRKLLSAWHQYQEKLGAKTA